MNEKASGYSPPYPDKDQFSILKNARVAGENTQEYFMIKYLRFQGSVK